MIWIVGVQYTAEHPVIFAGWVHYILCIYSVLYVCEREGRETVRWLDRQLSVRFKGSHWCLLPPPECCLAPGDTLLCPVWALLFIPITNTSLFVALKGSLQNPSQNLKTAFGFSSIVLKLQASYLGLMEKIFDSGELLTLLSFDNCIKLQHNKESVVSQNKHSCEES